jgi:glucosamine--fructose-6-phosphate aminotransferase (isomerizing)
MVGGDHFAPYLSARLRGVRLSRLERDMTQMADEIREIPDAIDRLLSDGAPAISEAAAAILRARPRWVMIVARGTSDHAALFARYLLEVRLGLPVVMAAPSAQSIYRAAFDWSGALVIGVSQSGASPDLTCVTDAAREGGALTVAVTNSPDSPLAASCEQVIDCHAGAELSVAATKSYINSLVALIALVAALDRTWSFDIRRLSAAASEGIAESERWIEKGDFVDDLARSPGVLVLGRGFNLATAHEVALKLIETSGRLALAYSTADAEHGPLSLAGTDVPIVVFEPPGIMAGHVAPVVEKAARAGSRVWSVSLSDSAGGPGDGHSLVLPFVVPDEISPVPLVIPGELAAEALARQLGLDPDSPAGLEKVTLTL